MRRRLTATLAMSSPPRTHTWRMAGSVAVASALLLRMLATSPRNGGRRDLRSLSYLGELDRRLHFERSPSLIEEFLLGLEDILRSDGSRFLHHRGVPLGLGESDCR